MLLGCGLQDGLAWAAGEAGSAAVPQLFAADCTLLLPRAAAGGLGWAWWGPYEDHATGEMYIGVYETRETFRKLMQVRLALASGRWRRAMWWLCVRSPRAQVPAAAPLPAGTRMGAAHQTTSWQRR